MIFCIRSERGAALLTALMAAVIIGTLGATLVFVATTESWVSAYHRIAQAGTYAADAGFERAVGELRRTSSWEIVPGSGAAPYTAGFDDGVSAPRLADGTVLDLARLTAERQADSNAFYPIATDRPVWRLFGHAPLDRMAPAGAPSDPSYVVVWIADDVDDADGDPARDANGILMVRSEAFGIRGGRRAVEATIARSAVIDATSPGSAISSVAIVAWREAR